MSEIRSWDRTASKLPGEQDFTGGTSSVEGMYANIHILRVVIWPEDAPKQEDVPQAGTSVRRSTGGKILIVADGIPYRYQDRVWYLRVFCANGEATVGIPLSHLEVVSDKPQTYSEEEVREAVRNITYESNVDLIIRRLRGDRA